MFKPLSGSAKGFQIGIFVLRQVQHYLAMTFAISLSKGKRLILKHIFKPRTFTSFLLLLVMSRWLVCFGHRLSLAVHDER